MSSLMVTVAKDDLFERWENVTGGGGIHAVAMRLG
jgi:hypothetical protein